MIELVVAMAIAAIIAAAATHSMVMIGRSTTRMEQQSKVDEDAKILLDYVLGEVQGIGGDSVRPQMVISIDDNCSTPLTIGALTLPACQNNSDRLHFVMIDDTAAQCGIVGTPGVNATMEMTSACCNGGGDIQSFQNRVVTIIAANGHWQNKLCSNHTSTPGVCKCTMPPGLSGYNNSPPTTPDWTGGVITLGKAITYYLEDNVLKAATDWDGDGAVDVVDIAPDVYDFQVEMLFDVDGDGRPEVETTVFDDVASPASALRMLRLGMIVGAPVTSKPSTNTVQVLSGQPLTEPDGVILRPVVGTTSFRNLFLFY